MQDDQRVTLITRETIMQLLSDDEAAGVTTAERALPLSVGEEYLDLEHLGDGVRHAGGATEPMARILPKKAVFTDTWAKIVIHLPAIRSGKARSRMNVNRQRPRRTEPANPPRR